MTTPRFHSPSRRHRAFLSHSLRHIHANKNGGGGNEVKEATAARAELANLVGRGALFALGDSCAIIVQRTLHSRDVVRLYAALRVPLVTFDATP